MARLNKDWSKEGHIIFVCIDIVDQILGGARNINGRRIYPFNKGLQIYRWVHHHTFDMLKIGTSTNDIKLKLYR